MRIQVKAGGQVVYVIVITEAKRGRLSRFRWDFLNVFIEK